MMTQSGQIETPQTADAPLDVTRRTTVVGLAVLLTLSAALLAKQIACARVATKDACGFYLPLAEGWARGDLPAGQHVMIPPLQPMIVGLIASVIPGGADNLEFVARLVSAAAVLGLVIVAYAIARRVFSRRVGLAAAALTAANPYLIRYGAAVGPDSLYALALATLVLLLLHYLHRQQALSAVAAGACASLPGLLRGEGFALLAPAVLVVLLAHWRKGRASRLRGASHVLLILGVALCIWTPRLYYVYRQTGYPVLDVRLMTFLTGLDPMTIDAYRAGPLEAGRADLGPPPVLNPTGLLPEILDSLIVLGPITVGAALLWFIARRRLPRRGAEQTIVALFVLLQLALVAPVKLGSRYVITVVATAQLWGGAGLVELAELTRSARGGFGRFGRSLTAQFALLGILVGALAAWSLIFRNTGSLGWEERSAAGALPQRVGPGPVLLCSSPRPAYYARGKYVVVVPTDDADASFGRARLRDILARHHVDYVVVRNDEKWCPWLLDRQNQCDSPEFVSVHGDRDRQVFLLDGRQLLRELSSRPAADTTSPPLPSAPADR